MNARVRSALMWLLLLALPLQGYAAATLLHCGAGGRPGVTAPGAMPAHHDHAGMVAAAHETSHDHAAQRGHADVPKAKCSACAACCMGTALPPAAIVFGPHAAAPAPDAFESARAVVFCTDGPDRPPRQRPA